MQANVQHKKKNKLTFIELQNRNFNSHSNSTKVLGNYILRAYDAAPELNAIIIELFIRGIISLAFPLLAPPFHPLFRSLYVFLHRLSPSFQTLHFIYLVPSTYCRFLQFSIHFRVAYFMSRRPRISRYFRDTAR